MKRRFFTIVSAEPAACTNPPGAERRKKQYPRAMKRCPADHVLVEPTMVEERNGTQWYEYRAVQPDGTLGRGCDFVDLTAAKPVKARNVDCDWWWAPNAHFVAACEKRDAKS